MYEHVHVIQIHLAWYSLATDPKDGTFTRGQEIHRAGLEWVRWEMDLLSEVKAVVCF